MPHEPANAAPIGTEYVCTSITAGGSEPSTSLQPYKDNVDYVRFLNPHRGGCTAVELASDLWRSEYIVDNMEDVGSGVGHLATFVTERDNPRVHEG
ncbi:MAG TPA: hypothetical protein VD789_07185 [Thermomicrobiales bacterium]|nr:hypothetical protein [Thermomicrobiales bacterium]